MKSFREHQEETLDENLLRKGAVSAYAARGKRHGDNAVQSFRSAKRSLQHFDKATSPEEQTLRVATALDQMLDGMIELRNQLGAVSAQITASAVTQER